MYVNILQVISFNLNLLPIYLYIFFKYILINYMLNVKRTKMEKTKNYFEEIDLKEKQ